MNGGLTTDATLGRTARAALEHLRRHSGYPTWLLTRINDYERIVIAAVDPQFSIVANSVLPTDLATDRFLASASKMVVPVQLPNGQPYGALVGLSRELPPPMPTHAESLIPLLANTAGRARRSRGGTGREHPARGARGRTTRRVDRNSDTSSLGDATQP